MQISLSDSPCDSQYGVVLQLVLYLDFSFFKKSYTISKNSKKKISRSPYWKGQALS